MAKQTRWRAHIWLSLAPPFCKPSFSPPPLLSLPTSTSPLYHLGLPGQFSCVVMLPNEYFSRIFPPPDVPSEFDSVFGHNFLYICKPKWYLQMLGIIQSANGCANWMQAPGATRSEGVTTPFPKWPGTHQVPLCQVFDWEIFVNYWHFIPGTGIPWKDTRVTGRIHRRWRD